MKKQKHILLAFYKGTPWPTSCIRDKNMIGHFQKLSHEMITTGLRMGISLDTQKQDYLTQLNKFESTLIKHSSTGQAGGIAGPNSIKKVCEELGMDEKTITSLWYLDVGALLELKVIENDNMNGWWNQSTDEDNIDRLIDIHNQDYPEA